MFLPDLAVQVDHQYRVFLILHVVQVLLSGLVCLVFHVLLLDLKFQMNPVVLQVLSLPLNLDFLVSLDFQILLSLLLYQPHLLVQLGLVDRVFQQYLPLPFLLSVLKTLLDLFLLFDQDFHLLLEVLVVLIHLVYQAGQKVQTDLK